MESYAQVATYEEILQPKLIFDFEMIDVDSDMDWPSWRTVWSETSADVDILWILSLLWGKWYLIREEWSEE